MSAAKSAVVLAAASLFFVAAGQAMSQQGPPGQSRATPAVNAARPVPPRARPPLPAPARRPVPEIDAKSGVAAIALLTGVLLLLSEAIRRRRDV